MQYSQFVDVGDIRTRYFEAGTGPQIVLIHGGGFGTYYNAYHWSLNFDFLAARYHTIAVDKLGMGYTDNPKRDEDYTMAKTIEHLARFITQVSKRPSVLVGHSRGALPAARIAVDYPELVCGLVIVDSNTLAPDHPSMPRGFYKHLNRIPAGDPDSAFVREEPEANSVSFNHITEDFVGEMVGIARLPKTRLAREAMVTRVELQFREDTERIKYETLDRIRGGELTKPTLVVWGLNDTSAPIVMGYQLFASIALRNARAAMHVIAGGAHYVYREHAEQFNRELAEFVGQVNGSV